MGKPSSNKHKNPISTVNPRSRSACACPLCCLWGTRDSSQTQTLSEIQAAFLLGAAISACKCFAEDHAKLQQCEHHEAQPYTSLGEELSVPVLVARTGSHGLVKGGTEWRTEWMEWRTQVSLVTRWPCLLSLNAHGFLFTAPDLQPCSCVHAGSSATSGKENLWEVEKFTWALMMVFFRSLVTSLSKKNTVARKLMLWDLYEIVLLWRGSFLISDSSSSYAVQI